MLAEYLIIAVILDFTVHFLLLFGTNRISGFPGNALRCATAAALAAAVDAAALGLRLPAVHLAVLPGAGVAAFGWNRGTPRRLGIYLFLRAALWVFCEACRVSQLPAMLLCMGSTWMLSCLASGQGSGDRLYLPLVICHGGKRLELIALRDTGNGLRDPVTGEGVVVLDPEPAQLLTGLTPDQLANPMETLCSRPIPGLRLIPYHSVGGSGMLLGMRMEEVRTGCERGAGLVAFAPHSFGKESMYQALTGGAL